MAYSQSGHVDNEFGCPTQKFKLYLMDSNGNSPSFGVDEIIELSAGSVVELDAAKADAKANYADYLVSNEGFAFSDIVGYDVCRDGIEYEVRIESIS